MIETLYRPKGAGHDAPDREPRNYVQPKDKLVNVFGRWLDIVGSNPNMMHNRFADKMLYDMSGGRICYWSPRAEISSEEISSLVMCFDSHPNIRNAGVFVTALYNGLRNDDFVFDAEDVVVDWVGWGLQEGNRLTIDCDTGESTGMCNRGVIINNGNSRDLGKATKGHIINRGHAYSFGNGSEYMQMPEKRTGFLLNYGTAEWVGHKAGNVMVNYGKADTLSQDGVVQVFNFGEARDMGEESSGPLVNFGKCRTMGHSSKYGPTTSIAVNDGDCKYITSALDGPEIVMAVRNPKVPHLMKAKGILMDEDDCRGIPGIRKYLDGLRDRLGPHRHYTEVLAHLEGLDVGTDIRRILTEAGRLEA